MAGIVIPTYTGERTLPASADKLPAVRMSAAPSAADLGGNARTPTDYIGAGLRSAGGDLMDVGLKMQAREDADLVMRAEVQLHGMLREKQTDWSSRKGSNAWGLAKDAQAWWDDESVKAAEGLNERQRIAFEQTRQRLRTQSLDGLSKYEFDQRRSSLDESAHANIVSNINHAVTTPHDDAAIDAAREAIDRAVAVRAGINGWALDAEQFKNERGRALTLLHKQVLQALVDDPAAAKAYYAKHKDEIDGTERAGLKDRIDKAARLDVVQRFADENDPRNGGTVQEALDAARKKFEGEDERLAVAEVKMRFAEHKAAKQQQDDEIENAVYAQLYERGSIAAIDKSLMAMMQPKARAQLVNTLESRAASIESRAAARENREWTRDQRKITTTEAQGLDNYLTLSEAFSRDPSSVTEAMVIEAGRKRDISAAQTERLVGQIRNNAVRADAVHLPTLMGVLSPIVKEQKWSGSKGKAKAGLLQQVAEGEILAEQQRTGKPMSQDEMRGLVNRLIVSGTVEKDYWFDDKKQKFEVLGTEDEARWKPKQVRGSTLVTPKQRGPQRTVVRTGTNRATGERVVEYSDGTIERIKP